MTIPNHLFAYCHILLPLRENIFFKISSNSELLGNLEEIFLLYYMHSDVSSIFSF